LTLGQLIGPSAGCLHWSGDGVLADFLSAGGFEAAGFGVDLARLVGEQGDT
jgi:hypothetical protein